MPSAKDPPTVVAPPLPDDGETTAYSPAELRTLLGGDPEPPALDEPKTTLWTAALLVAPSADAPTLLRRPITPRPAMPSSRRTRPTPLRQRGLLAATAAGLTGCIVWLALAHQRPAAPMPPQTASATKPTSDASRHVATPRTNVVARTPTPATAQLQPKTAVQALVDGKLDQALATYRALATRHPDAPVYAVAARVLARRVEGCDAAGETPCAR